MMNFGGPSPPKFYGPNKSNEVQVPVEYSSVQQMDRAHPTYSFYSPGGTRVYQYRYNGRYSPYDISTHTHFSHSQCHKCIEKDNEIQRLKNELNVFKAKAQVLKAAAAIFQ